MVWTDEHRGFVVVVPWAFDLFKGRRGVTGTVTRFKPLYVFLWGYLKEKVFKHRPRSLEDFKERIQQEIASIPPELTRRVMKNFRERLQQCVANDGCLMSDLICKTH